MRFVIVLYSLLLCYFILFVEYIYFPQQFCPYSLYKSLRYVSLLFCNQVTFSFTALSSCDMRSLAA